MTFCGRSWGARKMTAGEGKPGKRAISPHLVLLAPILLMKVWRWQLGISSASVDRLKRKELL